MKDISNEAQALFARYLECWNNRDFEGVAACFDEPSMFVLPTGPVSLPNRQALVELIGKIFDGLEAAGFSHTTIGAIEAHPCGDGLAILDARDVSRFKKDGSILETIDGHYVIRQSGEEWCLAVAVPCATGWKGAAS